MTFCNYTNVIDYCCNNFTYEYASVISSISNVVASGNSVYRIDKNTNDKILLNSYSLDPLISCDVNDEETNITNWGCFEIYKDVCNNTVNAPSVSVLIENHINNINNTNIKVTLNDRNIILDASLESQAHLQATLALAHILYREVSSSQMPYITDIYDRAYILSYNDLKSVINSYLKTCISRSDQFVDRLDKINNTLDESFLNNIEYYNSEKPQAYVENTLLPIDDNIPDVMPELGPGVKDIDGTCIATFCYWLCTAVNINSYYWGLVTGCGSDSCDCEEPPLEECNQIGKTTETQCHEL
jgi:hypothetical protein